MIERNRVRERQKERERGVFNRQRGTKEEKQKSNWKVYYREYEGFRKSN